MGENPKVVAPPTEKTLTAEEQFERFVSASIRTLKKEVDEKQRKLAIDRQGEKGLPEDL